MMRRSLVVEADLEPSIRLRTINRDDIEDLRAWKNAAKAGFFFQGEINDLMQKAWFAGYLERTDDYMFVVERDGKKAGCLGFRLEKGAADIYNVIAAPGEGGRGTMTAAMKLLCSYIANHHTKQIGCLVLKGNAARGFYERCGFKITGEGKGHDILTLDWTAAHDE